MREDAFGCYAPVIKKALEKVLTNNADKNEKYKYYFNDPYDNHGLIGYPRDIVEARHKAQYEMAVGIKKI